MGSERDEHSYIRAVTKAGSELEVRKCETTKSEHCDPRTPRTKSRT